jgi:hypothetical protein
VQRRVHVDDADHGLAAHSGAHIAERICCIRIDSPDSKRWSSARRGQDPRPFCLTTMSTIVREYGVVPSEV